MLSKVIAMEFGYDAKWILYGDKKVWQKPNEFERSFGFLMWQFEYLVLAT